MVAMMKKSHLIAAGVVAAVGLVVVLKMRSQTGNIAADLGYSVGSAAFNAADGLLSGVVLSAGDAIGIPRTNKTQCELDKAAGRSWDASFSCPAKDFISYMWN